MAEAPHAHRPSQHRHDDHDHAGHDHHGHGHHHAPGDKLGTAFALATALNLGFVVVEGIFGFLSHSMALVADAGHNFSDVLGLIAAWAASILTQRRPSQRYTYGLRSSSILAALLNAIILLIAVGGIAVEAMQRLFRPEPVDAIIVMAVAGTGVLINGASALLLGHGHGDLNVKSAFAHMVSDMLVSLGVVASGAVILWTGWVSVDPAVSIIIAIVIVIGTWQLLRHSLDMALDAVPPGIDPAKVREHLAHIAGVAAVHDLHIWPMSTTSTALTCHLVMPAGHPGDAILTQIADDLHHRFAIEHTTIQVECGDPEHPCVLVPDHVV